MTVGVLLLAAGSSRRFGSDKRMAPFAPKQQVLAATLENIRNSGLEAQVCLRAHDDALAASLSSKGVSCQQCLRSIEGMGSTLAEGTEQLPDWAGVIIALADMPWVRADTFSKLANALGEGRICIPTFHARRGNPVGFSRAFFTQLTEIRGDKGARSIIEQHPNAVLEVAVEDPGILRDIDRPSDLQHH